MENYVTLFDSKYLPQGIALHSSLMRFGGNFCLWIVCIDEKCYELLRSLGLVNVNLLKLRDCETDELRDIKNNRTLQEYCWTLTPFVYNFVFDRDEKIERLTYLDADVWLRKPVTPIFDEFNQSRKKVLITDHGYAPEYDASATSGQYCVQFVSFIRLGSEMILKEWQNQCLEWCFNRIEDGKFGDQKYLDNWPVKYPDLVHVLQKEHLTLAPWNASRFPYGNSVLWHFHGLRLSQNPESELFHVSLCETYPLLDVVKKNIYFPYVKEISSALQALSLIGRAP